MRSGLLHAFRRENFTVKRQSEPELDREERLSSFLSNLAHNHGWLPYQDPYSLTYTCKEDRSKPYKREVYVVVIITGV